ncbi:uncharacterized protein ACNLHF_026395 isoform 1-T2 [Anomaloglossus baeobatrachus]|uniref:uncharacterized protein LOC142246575 n=1 Tax=Anomaloglossus baeobatrachus TaxID=238106 RepID=UPI003F503707
MYFENMGELMCQKLNKLKEIMEQTKGLSKGKKSSQPWLGHNVVVIADLELDDVHWLVTILDSLHFKEQVKKTNFINISTIKEKNWEKQSAEYTFLIYVHREYDSTQNASPTPRVKSLSLQGSKHLVVVIDNARIGDNEAKARIQEKYPNINKYARGLFLFTMMEKLSDYKKFLYNSPEPEHHSDARGNQAAISQQVVFGTKYSVGIFSSSADRDYAWLKGLLSTDDFRDHVLSVRPCFISNNGYQQMSEDLSHCTFGILYHTKKKGRVNVTDVTDSLYDEELQQLSMTLGKKNTIVVIDDLEDSGNEKRNQILFTQPAIANYASDLILISYEDKTANMGQSAKSKILNCFRKLSGGNSQHATIYSPYEDESNMSTYKYSQRETEGGPGSYPSLDRSVYPSYMPPEELTSSLVGRASPVLIRSTVGIFSKSEERDYFWLEKLLTSEEFGYKDVQCCKVSGSEEALREVAFKIKFGILYHSVKNGKIRLTDVKDALYHQELELLWTKLGKRRLIVVIDDLDDIGHKFKQQILDRQPSLGRLVADIILITTSDKKNLDQRKDGSKMSKCTMDKISNMKKMLS